MAFCELKFFNKALNKATAADIILPESRQEAPFSVLYLLHGLSDDNTNWQRRTSIERYVENLPLIVVMPDGGRGFYCDAKQGMAWETALVRDLIKFIDTLFQTKASREGRCLAGLSMGGYGAIKLALKYPELFCSAVSHSGAMEFAHRPLSSKSDNSWEVEFSRVVGENSVGGPDDLFALAEGLKPEQRPALRIDCGTEDFLLNANRSFHDHLTQLGFDHAYAKFPGAHNWAYWDLHIQEAIAFHVRHLGLASA